jgi:hypothetical protein
MAGAREPQRTEGSRPPAGTASVADISQRSNTDLDPARNGGSTPRYEPNPKHKEPWQRGARGSLCPRDADGPELLAGSEIDAEHPSKRYATDGTRAYCGHEHSPGRWHGFPVEWRAVPASIRNAWLADGRVSRRAVRDQW